MANLRNLLVAGDYAVAVPEGLQLTIEYNAKGHIYQIYQGFGTDGKNLTSDLLTPFIKFQVVPNVIPIKNTQTLVEGVLHTTQVPTDRGELPYCVFDSLLEMFKKNHRQFKFYAANVITAPSCFTGAMSIRQWLQLSRFDMLPGFLVPRDMTEEQYLHMLNPHQFNFNVNTITDFICFNRDESRVVHLGLRQFVIKGVRRYIDHSGYIFCELSSSYGRDKVSLPIATVIHNNLQTDFLVVMNPSNDICFTHYTKTGARPDKLDDTITCSVCGRKIEVPASGLVCCADPNCNSRLYNDVLHFLSVLGLTEITYETYQDIVKEAGLGFCVADVLDYIPTSSTIRVTVPAAMFAVVPTTTVATIQFFDQFFESCNKNIHTVQYYLSNPDKIKEDLHIRSVYVDAFVAWISEAFNFMTMMSILQNTKLKFVETNFQFKCSPIFRGKKIILTGKFKRGTQKEVSTILENYSATCVDSPDMDVDCLIVGSLNEETNGAWVKECRELDIPVYDEDRFFKHYEIDQDLAENLK